MNLKFNEISLLSSIAFKGLHSLTKLDLSYNRLVNLPKDTFLDLSNLHILDMYANRFTVMPTHAFEPLHSLQYFSFANPDAVSDISFVGFQNTLKLNALDFLATFTTNITNEILFPLSRASLQELDFHWIWLNSRFSIESHVFAPLANVTTLIAPFSPIPVLESLNSPLNVLSLKTPADHNLYKDFLVVSKKTLQVLQKWKSSLTVLQVNTGIVQRVEDFTFIWTPSLLILDLGINEINYLEQNAFYGLTLLENLILTANLLYAVPSGALEVFKNCASFQHLDLSSNKITGTIENDAFSAVSSSLIYLDLQSNSFATVGRYKPTVWLSLFQKLDYLVLGDQTQSNMRIEIQLQSPLQTLHMSVYLFPQNSSV